MTRKSQPTTALDVVQAICAAIALAMDAPTMGARSDAIQRQKIKAADILHQFADAMLEQRRER